jgi:Fe-Mn family superoxide dismutase
MTQQTPGMGSPSASPSSGGNGQYTLPSLRYSYADLEPVIDQQTMEIHYSRHHQGYVDALNGLLARYPQWQGLPVAELLSRSAELPDEIRTSVINQGGGHANHSLFWECLTARQRGGPSDELAAELSRCFGSVDAFKSQFEAAGVRHFASGWVALAMDPKGDHPLSIITLPNHGTLHGSSKTSLLICDLWEHAYYLKHKNRRSEWLATWWAVVDWDGVLERFSTGRAGTESSLRSAC